MVVPPNEYWKFREYTPSISRNVGHLIGAMGLGPKPMEKRSWIIFGPVLQFMGD